jgi:hypothetical protein
VRNEGWKVHPRKPKSAHVPIRESLSGLRAIGTIGLNAVLNDGCFHGLESQIRACSQVCDAKLRAEDELEDDPRKSAGRYGGLNFRRFMDSKLSG